MTNMPIQNNHSKNKVRSQVISKVPKNCNCVLDIPGPEIMSTIELIKQNKITKNTIIHTIERNKKSNNIIIKKFKNKKIKHVAHNLSLENFQTNNYFDFVNLDTCSCLNEGILNVLSKLNFNKNATLSLWVTGFRSKGELKSKILSYGGKHSDNGDYIRNTAFTTKGNELTNAVLIAIAACLNKYDFEMNSTSYEEYTSNKTKMYVYTLHNINPTKKIRSVLNFAGEQRYNYIKKEYISTQKSTLTGSLPNQLIQAFTNNKQGQINHLKIKAKQELENRKKDKKWILAGWKSCVSKICNNKELAEKIHKFINSIIHP